MVAILSRGRWVNWSYYTDAHVQYVIRTKCACTVLVQNPWKIWVNAVVVNELWSKEGNKHHNNTPVSAETIRHERTYIILFLTQRNKSINDNKNDNL